MSLNICQKCGKPSLIKTPHGRIMLEEFFTEVHIANEYSFDCLKCGYSSGVIERILN